MEMTVFYYCPEVETDTVPRFRGKRVSTGELVEGVWAMVSDTNRDFACLILANGERVMVYKYSLEQKEELKEWVKSVV
jgi:hypothetical protein